MTESAEDRARRSRKVFEKATGAHHKGRRDEAIAGYVKALEIDPESSQALNNMGVALRAKGAFHAAVASYQRAIEIKADDPGSIPTSATRCARWGGTAKPRRATAKP